MAVFAISFRVMDGPRWDQRYDALVKAIEGEASGPFWAETTSFYLLSSGKSSVDLHAAIWNKAKVNNDDILVVINISVTTGHATEGIANLKRFNSVMSQRS